MDDEKLEPAAVEDGLIQARMLLKGMPGTKDYTIISKLAHSESSEFGIAGVYKAQKKGETGPVAVKIIPLGDFSKEFRSRGVKRQLELCTPKLNHSNIIGHKTTYEDARNAYIFMEYFEGHTFDDFSHSERTDYRYCNRVLNQILQGLYHAHQQGVVHGDIKWDNVLVNPNCKTKIVDWGLARATFKKATSSTGAAGFRAPEMTSNKKLAVPLDGRSDIFSTGILMHCIYEANENNDHEIPKALRSLHADGVTEKGLTDIINTYVRPERLIGIPEETRENAAKLVRKCLQFHPNDRYANAEIAYLDLNLAFRPDKIKLVTQLVGQDLLEPSAFESAIRAYDSLAQDMETSPICLVESEVLRKTNLEFIRKKKAAEDAICAYRIKKEKKSKEEFLKRHGFISPEDYDRLQKAGSSLTDKQLDQWRANLPKLSPLWDEWEKAHGK